MKLAEGSDMNSVNFNHRLNATVHVLIYRSS